MATTFRRGTARGSGRGQTTLDFVIAIGVFLLAVAFVFVFMTGMMDPFTQDAGQEMVADRFVDTVVEDLTVTGQMPNELDEARTVDYFTRVDDSSSSLTEQAGVSQLIDVNVTIGYLVEDGPGLDVLCIDDGSITETCAGDRQRLQVGDPVPDSTSSSVATARRSVVIDDRIAIVEVRAWR